METVSKIKGKRCPNFTKVEEKLLLQLVAKYSKEVECKRSDTDTNKIKAAAWNKICKEFNSVGNIQEFRDAASLRKKYENYKKVLKRKHAANRKTFYKTGGGPSSPPEPPSETDDIVSGIISSQVDGFNSEFDTDVIDDTINSTDAVDENDFIFETPNTSSIEVFDTRINEATTTPNISIISDIKTNEGAILVSDSIGTNWAKYTPEMLKNAKHKALKTGLSDKRDRIGNCRTGDLKSKLGQWASKKQLFVKTQEECFIREHELTMAHKKEKHALEMKHAEELHQEMLQQMREKHKREMDKI